MTVYIHRMLRKLSPAIRQSNRYIVALLVLIVLIAIRSGMFVLFGTPTTFSLLVLGVLVSAWYGGLGPGLLVTFLGAGINFFLPSSGALTSFDHLVLTSTFILEGSIVSFIGETRLRAARERREFISAASHELKNPLSAILNFAELLRLSSAQGKAAEVGKYAAKIESETRTAARLLNDLSDIAQYDIGKLDFQEERYDLRALLEEAVEAHIARSSHVVRFSGGPSFIATGDRRRIRQVFNNLIGNAIKYSPGAQEVLVGLEVMGDRAVVSVQDFGIGIEPEEGKRIFERFYRSQRAERRGIGGMGLGLNIAERIIAHHGGSITVTSEPGRGSIFSVLLPQRRDTALLYA